MMEVKLTGLGDELDVKVREKARMTQVFGFSNWVVPILRWKRLEEREIGMGGKNQELCFSKDKL